MTADDKRIVAERFADAGLATDRFINVIDGEKGTRDHDTRYSDPREVPGRNYGIYPGGGLVDVDIDDYSDGTGNDGLAAILNLPDTLAVETPHTDGERGGHRYLHIVTDRPVEGFDTEAVLAGVAERTAEAARNDPVALALAEEFGTPNPQPSWGEVRAVNQYVVGPGSQLDKCNKEWCDECSNPDGGWYRVAADAPIATITADEFVDALRADPDLDTEADRMATPSADDRPGVNVNGTGYDPAGTSIDAVIPEESKLATYLAAGAKAAGFEANDGGHDRSRADYYAACVAVEYGVPESEIRDTLKESGHSKVGAADAPRDYWARTWSKAVEDADANSKAKSETPQDLYQAEKDAYEASSDSEKAYAAWKILKDRENVLAAQPAGTIYAYQNGIWNDTGKQYLRERAHDLMRTDFSRNALRELCEQVRATKPKPVDELGAEPGRIAVSNGLLDLENRTVRPLKPEDYALARLPVEFDPDATCPRFIEFLKESAYDGDLKKLQEYVGYTLHHWGQPYKKALLLVGPTDSGKSTFLKTIRALLGAENIASESLYSLMSTRWGTAKLFGKIANIRNELTPREVKNPQRFKELTGGEDMVDAEFKGQDKFEFVVTQKFLFATNRVPDIEHRDDAFNNRWLFADFPHTIPVTEQDPDLADALKEELPGILNWAIDGYHRLIEQGRFSNERPLADKEEMWKEHGGPLDRFKQQALDITGDPDHCEIKSRVHDEYTRFCDDIGEDALTQSALTRKLNTDPKISQGQRRFNGDRKKVLTGVRFADPELRSTTDDDSPGAHTQAGLPTE